MGRKHLRHSQVPEGACFNKIPQMIAHSQKQPPSNGREERLYFHDKRLYKAPSKYNVFRVLAFNSGNPMEFHSPARSHRDTRLSAMGRERRFITVPSSSRPTSRKQQKRWNGCIIIISAQWSHLTLQIAELFQPTLVKTRKALLYPFENGQKMPQTRKKKYPGHEELQFKLQKQAMYRLNLPHPSPSHW